MPQLCKYRSQKKIKNLRRGLFIVLKSTLCGFSALLAGFLNSLPYCSDTSKCCLLQLRQISSPQPHPYMSPKSMNPQAETSKCIQGGTPIFPGIEHSHWMYQGREWIIFALTENIGEAPPGTQHTYFGHWCLQSSTDVQERKITRNSREMKSTSYEQRLRS